MTDTTEVDALVARLRERAGRPQGATDEGKRAAAPPAPAPEIDGAQARLGFALPAFLRRLYAEVGDGGFGPGPGLPALASDAGALGRARLFPLCDWGSGIASALDCTRPGGPVVRVDSNMPKADVPARVPPALHFARAAEVKPACWVESATLEEWLTAWLDGRALFYAAYAGPDAEDDGEDEDEEAGDV